MDVLSGSIEFMSYVDTIKQVTFGGNTRPYAISKETVSGISVLASSQRQHDKLEVIMDSNKKSQVTRMSKAEDTVYNREGGIAGKKGGSINMEV